MALDMNCANCGKHSPVPEAWVGKEIKCPECGHRWVVARPGGLLDSAVLMWLSVGLLVVSMMVGGGVGVWAGVDIWRASQEQLTAMTPEPDKPTGQEQKEARTSVAVLPGPAVTSDEEKKSPQTAVILPARPEPRVSEPAPAPFGERELRQRLLKSAVWICTPDGSGSGAVIHAGRRWIITNEHVVRGHARVRVLFPQYDRNGHLIEGKQYYKDLLKGGTFVAARVVPGSVDARRDLAVIELEDRLPPGIVAVQVAPRFAATTDKLVSVGNPGPSNALWVPAQGNVRSRVPEIRLRVPKKDAEGNVTGVREVLYRSTWTLETNLPINHGDSGSPVVNLRGQLVGVNCGGLDADPVTGTPIQGMQWAVDRDEVLGLLEHLGLKKEEVLGSDVAPASDAAVDRLVKQINDVDPMQCRKGVEELGKLDSEQGRRAIPALVTAMLRHKDDDFHKLITGILQRIGPPYKDDVQSLHPLMTLSYQPARVYAIDALRQLGADARPGIAVLVQGLKDRDGEVRRKAAEVLASKDLGRVIRPLAFKSLMTSANDADEEVSKAALNTLLGLGPLTSAEVDLLIEAVKDPKRVIFVRRYAAWQLGLQKDHAAEAIPALVGVLLQDKDVILLEYATASLKSIVLAGPADKVTELKPLLQHKTLARWVLDLLREKNAAGGLESAVAALVKDPDRQVSWKALAVLTMLGKAAHPALPELLPLVKEGMPRQRLQVALTVAAIESTDEKVVQSILPVLTQGLHPSNLTDDAQGTIDRIHKALRTIRKPAVESLFVTLEKMKGEELRGPLSEEYRANLFRGLKFLGNEYRSKANHERLATLRTRELGLPGRGVQKVATEAMQAMELID